MYPKSLQPLIPALALLALATAPALAAPKHLPSVHPWYPRGAVAEAAYQEAQNAVFPGHDGHVILPGPEDWLRYHEAEAARPLFPCLPPRRGRERRKP